MKEYACFNVCLSQARGQLHKPILLKTPTTVLRLQEDLEQMTIPVVHCLIKFKIKKSSGHEFYWKDPVCLNRLSVSFNPLKKNQNISEDSTSFQKTPLQLLDRENRIFYISQFTAT